MSSVRGADWPRREDRASADFGIKLRRVGAAGLLGRVLLACLDVRLMAILADRGGVADRLE